VSAPVINKASYLRILSLFACRPFPVSRGIPARFTPAECPPLFVLVRVSPGSPPRSTQRGRFSDEPFRVRDVQFQSPRILVKTRTFGEEASNFDGTCGFGGPNSPPGVCPVERQNALEAREMQTAAADDEQQRTALGIALAEDSSEAAERLGSAQDPGGLDVRGQPVAQAASRSSAPISTAARASRLRAPRSFSSVAAWRVTRLIAAKAFKCSAPASTGDRSKKTRSTG
jgi:hypothetical protein